MGADFPSSGKTSTCVAVVASRRDCPTGSSGRILAGIVAAPKMVPKDVQWHAKALGNACHNARAAHSLAGIVAPRGS